MRGVSTARDTVTQSTYVAAPPSDGETRAVVSLTGQTTCVPDAGSALDPYDGKVGAPTKKVVPMSTLTNAPAPADAAQALAVDRFRRRFCGWSLITAAVLLVAAEATTPEDGSENTTAELVRVFTDNPTQTQVSAVLLHFAALLVLPGIVGLLRLTRLRAVKLAHVGAFLAFLGFASLAGNVIVDLFHLTAGQELTTAQASGYLDATSELPGALAFIVPAFLGSFLGMLLLFIALGRSGELAWHWVALVVVGLVLIVLAPNHAFLVVGFGAMAGALAAAGARLLRE